MQPEGARHTWLAVAALIGAMGSLAVGTSFAKRLFPVVGAEGTTAFRVAFAALMLLGVWRPWRFALRARDAAAIVLYGAALGAMNLLFYASLRTVPFGLAVAIEFTGPLAVAVLSSRRAIDFAWIALSALGLCLLLPLREGGARVDALGAAYALSAGVCWALYIVFGHRLASLHGGQATSLGMSVAALIVLPFGVVRAGAALLDPALVASGLVVALLSSAVPYSLEMLSLRRLPKRTFSVLLSLEPVFAALAGWLLLSEALSLAQWLAIASVIGASIGSTLTSRATPATVEEPALP